MGWKFSKKTFLLPQAAEGTRSSRASLTLVGLFRGSISGPSEPTAMAAAAGVILQT